MNCKKSIKLLRKNKRMHRHIMLNVHFLFVFPHQGFSQVLLMYIRPIVTYCANIQQKKFMSQWLNRSRARAKF